LQSWDNLLAAAAKRTPDTPWTTTDVARVFGLSLNTISRLQKERIIVRNHEGRFDQAATARAILAHREQVLKNKFAVDGAAKAKLAEAKAGIATLELEKREGTVIETKAAVAVMTRVIHVSKARLLGIPRRIAPRLCGSKSAAEAEQLVAEEIHLALTELSAANLAEEIAATIDF
jgi:phage terminase Nu1 subunit (DNA packaging protein)